MRWVTVFVSTPEDCEWHDLQLAASTDPDGYEKGLDNLQELAMAARVRL